MGCRYSGCGYPGLWAMLALVVLKTSEGGRWSLSSAEALVARGHEVVFALPSSSGTLPDAVRAAGFGLTVIDPPFLDKRLARYPRRISRLRRQIDGVGPDVVISHLYASALAGRLSLIGSCIPHIYVSAGPLYLESAIIREAERLLWRLDDHLVCSSSNLLERYLSLGVPASRLSLVPYSVSSKWAVPTTALSRKEARKSLGIRSGAFVVVCVAYFYAPRRIVHRGRGIKGHPVLLDAWRRFLLAGGEGDLLLVGGGFGSGGAEYRETLMARFAGLPSVRWIGTAADVRPYYVAADMSVSPSLSDNLGAPVEAAALGVPSIASRVGGLPEIVVDRWNGWLVPPGDSAGIAGALREAVDLGRPGRQRYGERARLRADELCNEERNGEAFADVVERVVTRARQRRRGGS